MGYEGISEDLGLMWAFKGVKLLVTVEQAAFYPEHIGNKKRERIARDEAQCQVEEKDNYALSTLSDPVTLEI